MKSIILYLLFVIFASSSIYAQSTITSTVTGGNWGDTLTWVNHQIPTEEDNVIISGPVFLYNISAGAKCKNLTVNNELSGSYILDVHGTLENNGLIKFYDDDLYFHLNIYGDLINNGNWDAHYSTLVTFKSEDPSAPRTHVLSCPNNNYIFANRLVISQDNKLQSTTNLFFKNTQIIYNGEEIPFLDFKLLDNSAVTFENCELNNIKFDGHEALLNLNENTKLEHSIVANSITTYTNKAEIYGTEFTSDSPLINNDTLWIWGSISAQTTVSQNFENYGYVTKASTFFLEQTLINKNQFLGLVYLSGDSTQQIWLDEIFEGTLMGSGIIEGTAIFSDAFLKGNFTIPANATVKFTNNTMVSDTLTGYPYASCITSDTSVSFGKTILFDLILKGETNFHYTDDNEFHGVVKNLGEITGSFRSYGLLINEGEILPYNIYFYNDFVNFGTISEDNTYWTSINFTGNTDQHIDLRNGSSLTHSNVRFHPELNGEEYSWFKDDIIQSLDRELYFDSLSLQNAGTYYCMVDDQQMHNIIVGSGMVTDVKDESVDVSNNIPSDFVLEQNYPNPFNPITTISYRIPETSRVILEIYNLAGQKITTLVKQHKSPGNYSVEFNASSLSSGIYFYSLQAGRFSATKKLIFLK